MLNLRYREQAYQVRGLIFKVRKELGTGWSEEICHQALLQAIQGAGISVVFKPRLTITHRGIEVHTFECDLLLWDLIILELKVLPYTDFSSQHVSQIIHYLKGWKKGLGLLVNFGPLRAKIKRIVWDEPKFDFYEEYDEVRHEIKDKIRTKLVEIRQIIRTVAKEYGLGYPNTMFLNIMALELSHRGFFVEKKVKVPIRLSDHKLMQHKTDHLLVDNCFLLNIRAMLDEPSAYDFMRTRTYLDALGLNIGLVINFGKRQMQIYGVGSAKSRRRSLHL